MSMTLEQILLGCAEDGDCLLWAGAKSGQGVPYAWLDGKSTNLRRFVFAAKKGPIPAGRLVHVTCLHPSCLADGHLKAVTRKELGAKLAAQGILNPPTARAKRIAAARERAKLSMEKAQAIRVSERSTAEEAALHGVGETCILNVRNYVTWREHARGASIFGGVAP
jgi:hypothetical protein